MAGAEGGITAHMIANEMFKEKELKHITVNILAFDPVPGAMNYQKSKTQLNKNVKKIRRILLPK
ncbi:hypothetical protein [Piscirickettsia litoralis]|uniref:hypothetical protein n=1 Tax=Piscirickettsia litoralis TaxID=1891921 RepID=UPI001112DA78|nr:hypothetical protein [Piscirickettsia litoralis]